MECEIIQNDMWEAHMFSRDLSPDSVAHLHSCTDCAGVQALLQALKGVLSTDANNPELDASVGRVHARLRMRMAQTQNKEPAIYQARQTQRPRWMFSATAVAACALIVSGIALWKSPVPLAASAKLLQLVDKPSPEASHGKSPPIPAMANLNTDAFLALKKKFNAIKDRDRAYAFLTSEYEAAKSREHGFEEVMELCGIFVQRWPASYVSAYKARDEGEKERQRYARTGYTASGCERKMQARILAVAQLQIEALFKKESDKGDDLLAIRYCEDVRALFPGTLAADYASLRIGGFCAADNMPLRAIAAYRECLESDRDEELVGEAYQRLGELACNSHAWGILEAVKAMRATGRFDEKQLLFAQGMAEFNRGDAEAVNAMATLGVLVKNYPDASESLIASLRLEHEQKRLLSEALN